MTEDDESQYSIAMKRAVRAGQPSRAVARRLVEDALGAEFVQRCVGAVVNSADEFWLAYQVLELIRPRYAVEAAVRAISNGGSEAWVHVLVGSMEASDVDAVLTVYRSATAELRLVLATALVRLVQSYEIDEGTRCVLLSELRRSLSEEEQRDLLSEL